VRLAASGAAARPGGGDVRLAASGAAARPGGAPSRSSGAPAQSSGARATAAFLARAAGEFLRGGWVFTGFHWPVLAGQLAARVAPGCCAQIFEAGGIALAAAPRLPTSTTDYAAFDTALAWAGSTELVFPALVRRADRVVLDAANVDVNGRVNSTAVGGYRRPKVRLPGGGGAADAAAAARELVLLHGGSDPRRIVARVEHVTAAPADGAVVRLLTRWGTLTLGSEPALNAVVADADGLDEALACFRALGIACDDAPPAPPPDDALLDAAAQVLTEAAERGYAVARAFANGAA
jgi:glutaconate CoA-transferase subunit B